jgi:hypothetical protein
MHTQLGLRGGFIGTPADGSLLASCSVADSAARFAFAWTFDCTFSSAATALSMLSTFISHSPSRTMASPRHFASHVFPRVLPFWVQTGFQTIGHTQLPTLLGLLLLLPVLLLLEVLASNSSQTPLLVTGTPSQSASQELLYVLPFLPHTGS